jgi:hypothetical protein
MLATVKELAPLITQYGLLPFVLCAIIFYTFKHVVAKGVEQDKRSALMLSVLEVQAATAKETTAALVKIAEQLNRVTISLAILATRIKADYVEDEQLAEAVAKALGRKVAG